MATAWPLSSQMDHLDSIRAAASVCKRALESFLGRISKYESSLGSWDAEEKRFRGIERRIQYNLSLETAVKELRATLGTHMATIQTLLLIQTL